MAWVNDILRALRKLDSLMQLEESHAKASRRHDELIAALAERQTRAEVREEIVVAKAEAAAATAASAAASQHVADLARRLGNLEARVAQLEGTRRQPPRLPPPE